ncbi:hypothetical protein JKP88DRAFT_321721, partial [Tribonema minus]
KHEGRGAAAISAAELKHADLKHTEVKEHAAGGPSADELKPIVALYERHGGDVRAIFEELGEHPGKALKHPPSDAADFARRYLGGGYTYTESAAAE